MTVGDSASMSLPDGDSKDKDNNIRICRIDGSMQSSVHQDEMLN